MRYRSTIVAFDPANVVDRDNLVGWDDPDSVPVPGAIQHLGSINMDTLQRDLTQMVKERTVAAAAFSLIAQDGEVVPMSIVASRQSYVPAGYRDDQHHRYLRWCATYYSQRGDTSPYLPSSSMYAIEIVANHLIAGGWLRYQHTPVLPL